MTPPYKTWVISPVGGPGIGKTTFSLGLCHALKKAGVRVEYVPEVIKHDVFTPDGVARVVSGRFDQRYLALQHRLTQGFLGTTEVVVNDGALEPFDHYARQRVPSSRWAAFEAQLARYRAAQSIAEHHYVTLDLGLAYDAHGRTQAAQEAFDVHQGVLASLRDRFGIVPDVVRSAADQERWVRQVVEHVHLQRSLALRSCVGPSPRGR